MEWEVQIMATNKPEKKTKTKLIGSDANKTIPYAIVEAYKSCEQSSCHKNKCAFYGIAFRYLHNKAFR